MSVPQVEQRDEVLERYKGARARGDHGPAFDELYDHARQMHQDMLELRAGYDRCRKSKGVLILLRKKAIQERDEARQALEQARAELEHLSQDSGEAG